MRQYHHVPGTQPDPAIPQNQSCHQMDLMGVHTVSVLSRLADWDSPSTRLVPCSFIITKLSCQMREGDASPCTSMSRSESESRSSQINERHLVVGALTRNRYHILDQICYIRFPVYTVYNCSAIQNVVHLQFIHRAVVVHGDLRDTSYLHAVFGYFI